MTDSKENIHTVLLVEDEEAIAKPLIKLMNLLGFETSWTKDGLEALEWLTVKDAPDCLLVDIMMPKMNGWQFREAQLQNEKISSIPVVFFSADNQSAREAEKRGESFVAKPIDLDLLNETIRNTIQRDQERQDSK